MANKRFTNAKLRSLKARKERYEVWEGGGFGLRIAPTGRKTFIYMYRFNGTARRMSLGVYPSMSLATGHEMLAKAQKMLEKGIDPNKKLIQAKKAKRDAETVADLAKEYIEKWAKPRKKSWKEDERILNHDVLPVWDRKKAASIARRDVIKLLDSIVDRGAPIQANRTLACISKLFNFALSRDIVQATPCSAIPAPAKENQRDRVLSEEEIHNFWVKLAGAKMSDGSRLVLRFQLLTAQRKGEIVAAEWNEFDLEKKIWTIPAKKSKNDLPHRVPLAPLALDLLTQIKETSAKSQWLFPSPTVKDKHVIPNSINKALQKNLAVFGIEGLIPHDLRRTAASHMTSMGISREIVSKVLNHAESGVTAVYDRHSYDKEKRQALDTWSRKLESIITGKKGKVLTLKRK